MIRLETNAVVLYHRAVLFNKGTSMTFKHVCAAVAVTMAGAFAITGANAQGRHEGKWENLGCAEVGRQSDLDTIKVGRSEGRFKAIRLEVERRDIFIKDLKVVYADGEPDHLAVNAEVADGRPTKPLDLKGWARAIDRIELVARKSQGEGRGKAKVCVQGLAASRDDIKSASDGRRDGGRDGRRDGGRDDVKELGCERVGFLADRDVIKVGRQAGKFRALRVGVSGNKIVMKSMRVIYADGQPDQLPVAHDIADGERTPLIDLKGDRRAIDRIELEYGTKPNFKGQARVCVYGVE